MHSLFVVCAPGVEPIAAAEVATILPGVTPTIVAGGLELTGDDGELYRLNLHLRTATRILVRAAEFAAPSFAALHRRAGACPWERFLRPGQAIVVRASAERSRLYHTGGIAERIARGIGDRLGVTPAIRKASDDDGDPVGDAALIVARVVRDRCSLSVDASGAALHRRGYRLATAKAPLRESLAAAILLAVAREDEAIVDPMCGSGTFSIEAALRSLQIAPGLRRGFAFTGWPGFDAARWRAIVAEAEARAEARRAGAAAATIAASDRDPGAIAATRANAGRAGVADAITITRAALAEVRAPCERGVVVLNPPYGQRIGDRRRLRGVYAAIGEALRRGFAGPGLAWRVALLAPAGDLSQETGLALTPRLRLRNGGIAVELSEGPIG